MTTKHPLQHLLDLIAEEAEIVDDDQDTPKSEKISVKDLNSAHTQIQKDGPLAHLTILERNAVRDALEDLGELYRFAGTSAGFKVQDAKEQQENRTYGNSALKQAAALGIYPRRS